MKPRPTIDPQRDVTALIIAGGRGSRLGGEDKGLLEVSGKPLIRLILDQISSQVAEVIISANRNLERYQSFGCPVIPDETADYLGPLAGIAATMKHIRSPYIVTLPCDAPVVAEDYVSRLARSLESTESAISVCHDGDRMQPLNALIPCSMQRNLEDYLARGDRAVNLWFRQNGAIPVDFSDELAMFANINTPAQLQEANQ